MQIEETGERLPLKLEMRRIKQRRSRAPLATVCTRRSPVQNLRAGTIPPLPFKSSLACLVRRCWGGQSMLCLSI